MKQPIKQEETTLAAGPVRDAHRFDEKALERYLHAHSSEFEGELRISQFEGGQSNPTFLVEPVNAGDSRDRKWVLRKKPSGKLLASAHMVEREYRLMTALRDSEVPVPTTRLLCEDASIIGTPFFVMDHVRGRIFRDPALPNLPISERRAVHFAAVETLAKLHGVDWKARGLEDYGRPDGYVARQVARWAKQYEQSKTREIPAMNWLLDWLPKNVPAEAAPAIVHGDYRIDNLVFDEHEPRVLAVLDWELSTIGDPNADVAYHCLAYHLPSGKPGIPGLGGRDLAAIGIPDEAEVVRAYARARGISDVPAFSFHLAFGLFRLAGIAQGIAARILQGNASSSNAAAIAAETDAFAEIAKRIAEGSST